MKIEIVKSRQFLPFLQDVARLRIEIFRDWPYLYEGDLESEEEYLKTYLEASDSLAVLVKDNDKIVGCAIGLAMAHAFDKIQQLFKEHNKPLERNYYFSDLLLLKSYRGQKLGLKMVQEFEKAVRDSGRFSAIYLMEIMRDPQDVRKPSSYHSLDNFWDKRGYLVVPNWKVFFDWQEVKGQNKVSHELRFRHKEL